MTPHRKIASAALILIFVLSLCASAGEAAPKPPGPDKDKVREKPSKEGGKPVKPAEEKKNYDKVWLKSGEVVEGRVVDSGGPVIHVERTSGSRILLKSDIEKIEFGKGRTVETPDEDIVFMKDGAILFGEVHVDPKTGKIVLKRKTGAGEGETILDPKEVLRIIYADPARNQPLSRVRTRKEVKANPLIATSIRERLKDLASDDPDRVAKAEKALIDYGLFAEADISEALKTAKGAYKSRLQKLDKLTRLKRIVAPDILTEFPDIYDCLMNTKYDPKFETLQMIQMLFPEDAPPILVHVALDSVSENKQIRYYCLKQINELNHPRELITIMEKADTPLAVLAAVFLGERGILLGIPLLIEALDMEDEGVRKLALEKLRDFTREDFGGTPYDPPERRKKWIEEWRKWLKKHEKRIQRQATVVRNSDIPEEDRSHSSFLYGQGQIAFEHGNTSEALYLFEEALRFNPANTAAHMNIAVLLYQEMRDYVGARERLLRLLKFYADRISTINLRDIFFHLGMIALAQKEWEDAQKRFAQATLQDNRFVKGYIALAKSNQAQLDMDEELRPKLTDGEGEVVIIRAKREKLLKDALEAYQEAESLISGTRRALKNEKYIEAWREGVEQLEAEKSGSARRPSMKTQVPADLIMSLRRMLKKRHAQVLAEISRCHLMRDDTRKAIKTIEKAVDLLPKDTGLLFQMAMLYESEGSLADAAKTYGKILALDPDNSTARKNLNQIRKLHPELVPEKE
ncbi:MAG: tetratricopeptide repeat protein [Planctomycetota bacterium]|nr:MAG: tetratricopeptide repeat protein [Planctomycetota bacterium]